MKPFWSDNSTPGIYIFIELETMGEEEQLDYLQKENENARGMVSDLMESLKGAMKAFKTTQKPVPKTDFTKRNESVEGILIIELIPIYSR